MATVQFNLYFRVVADCATFSVEDVYVSTSCHSPILAAPVAVSRCSTMVPSNAVEVSKSMEMSKSFEPLTVISPIAPVESMVPTDRLVVDVAEFVIYKSSGAILVLINRLGCSARFDPVPDVERHALVSLCGSSKCLGRTIFPV